MSDTSGHRTTTDELLALLDDVDDHDGFCPTVVTGTITAASADVATVSFTDATGTSRSGRLAAHEWAGPHTWQIGHTYTMLMLDPGPRPFLSTADPRLIPALLDGVSPEVRSGKVAVMGIARKPGARTKVAVAATMDGIDPVAACVGRNHNRVDDVRAAIGGEQVDYVAWNPDPAVFLANAMQPATCRHVVIDAGSGQALAVAPDHQMSAAVGTGGLNSALAGRLTGLRVRVIAESKASTLADLTPPA